MERTSYVKTLAKTTKARTSISISIRNYHMYNIVICFASRIITACVRLRFFLPRHKSSAHSGANGTNSIDRDLNGITSCLSGVTKANE